jgi:hypothetical protein
MTRALMAQLPLITRPLLLRFVSIIGSSVSFYLPLSVVPRYAASSGSDLGAVPGWRPAGSRSGFVRCGFRSVWSLRRCQTLFPWSGKAIFV